MKKVLVILLALVLCLSMFAACGGDSQTSDKPSNSTDPTTEQYHLGICIHSMDNAYWAQEAHGAELFASQIDNLDSQILTCDSDDNKQLQGIKDFIAKYGDKAMFVVDPSSAANTANIVETCEDAGCNVVILAHRAEGLFPENYKHFVAHMTQDDYAAGYSLATYLFDSIGGKGKVCELYGQLGNDAATLRSAGFNACAKEYPDIEILDKQVASWSQDEALKITETWLAKYDDVDAIFAANDTMALGAVEALKNAGKNGEVHVCGCDGIEAAFNAVKEGNLTCTIANDGYMIMGYGSAYAYYTTIGTLDPSKDLTPKERMIICKTAFVTQDNIDKMISSLITGHPDYDYSDLDFCIAGYQDRTNLK